MFSEVLLNWTLSNRVHEITHQLLKTYSVTLPFGIKRLACRKQVIEGDHYLKALWFCGFSWASSPPLFYHYHINFIYNAKNKLETFKKRKFCIQSRRIKLFGDGERQNKAKEMAYSVEILWLANRAIQHGRLYLWKLSEVPRNLAVISRSHGRVNN